MEGLHELVHELEQQAVQYANEKFSRKDLSDLILKLKNLDASGAPIVAITGPAGLIFGSASNIAIGAATTVDIVSAAATSLASGDRVSLRSVQSMSLFANEGDIEVTAASGKIDLQAQDDQLRVLAKKVVEIISNTDWITINAKKGVRINGGGTELELSAGGIKGYTAGKNEMYAASHQTFPAQERSVSFSDEKIPHKICVPCLLIAADAHSPFAKSGN